MGFRFMFPAMAVVAAVVFSKASAAGEGEINMVFYMHDTVVGNNVTAVPVAGSNGSSSSPGRFGTLVVISDVITKRPQLTESDSQNIVGRAQGTYVNTNLVTGLDFLMVFTVIFQDMENNGSTLEFHGTDRFDQPLREYAVIGGTGKFRFARGYAVVTTESLSGQNSVLKFNTTIRTH
jgi:hypothetical protein